MKRTIISALVVLLVIAGGWYALKHAPKNAKTDNTSADQNQVVATVNGESITRGELDRSLVQGGATTTEAKAQFQSQALDALINQKLLKQVVSKSGITASSTVVEAQLAQAKSQFGTSDAYNQALQTQGLTEATFRAQVQDNVALNAFLDKELNLSAVTASDAEIKTAYDQAAAGQTSAPKLAEVKDTVKQYVIGQKQQALINDYIAKLKASADIKKLI